MLIAVYGTLKRQYGNHRLLQGQKHIIDDYVEFKYLTGIGFPIVQFESGTGKWISVEVYEVDEDCLARCDALEGHPNWYVRIPVKTKSGLDVEIYNQQVKEERDLSEDFKIGENIYSWERAQMF